MPSLKSIRKRISSVKSTQKITKAMKMVAGARLARAQQRIVALRPLAIKTAEVLDAVVQSARGAAAEAPEGSAESALHPLLAVRPEKKVLFVVMTSDRGLCGAFNTNITRAVARELEQKKAAGIAVEFATCGRKGRDYLRRRNLPIANHFANVFQDVTIDTAHQVGGWVVRRFLKGEYDAVYLVYNEFKSAITQKVVFEPLLPLPSALSGSASGGGTGGEAKAPRPEHIFDPARDLLLERLVPAYVYTSIARALLESVASEHGARMSAMDSATRNASDLIDRLTLSYNRARQAAITKELMEIIGGAEALKE